MQRPVGRTADPTVKTIRLAPEASPRVPIGTLLVQEGSLSPEQLEEALAEKDITGHRGGEIVVEAVSQGMTTLRQDGLRIAMLGISSLDEIRRVTGDRMA